MSAAEKLQLLLGIQERCGGAIPFELFMQAALYDERFGYYSANIRGLGRIGDFSTWPMLQDTLARAVAKWASARKPRGLWHIIEVGAGSGDLARAILRNLGWWNLPRYHIVEVSPVLRKAQRQRLRKKAEWHASMREALQACDGSALIISNELVDAFPCRVFQNQTAGWRELFLRLDRGRLEEIWRETPRPDSTAFSFEHPVGQRIEVQPGYQLWLNEWRDAWKSGACLTIDYGDECPALYRRRPHGTLRAYAHHQRLEGREVYAGFGLRDLTVDVNFSDLRRWAHPSAQFMTLSAFLASQGQPTTTHFEGAGEAFKVLIESR